LNNATNLLFELNKIDGLINGILLSLFVSGMGGAHGTVAVLLGNGCVLHAISSL
jgi:hypothetical protein